ncbi:MAG: DNA alkylation repair protein [Treponema sp.]|nr:DNA alkylation repair protein [Treponema sp.]
MTTLHPPTITKGITDTITNELFSLQDKKYKSFQEKLIPTIPPASIIGVRTPALRAMAKKLKHHPHIDKFLNHLPHKYFDENQLHAFIISEISDFEQCIKSVSTFLPYINNWATCDQLSSKCFKKNKTALLSQVLKWLKQKHTYTKRFAIGMLMQHFLEDDFKIDFATLVCNVRSNEYYVNMMRAWYFATALSKQYDAVLPFIENKKLDAWTHNKAIQKAIESRRISDERKNYLRELKSKAKN